MTVDKRVLSALNKAHDTIDDAEANVAEERLLAAVNRAYYAIFYAINALLFSEDITTKTHTGAHTQFNDRFVKTGLFSKTDSQLVKNAFNTRQKTDYDFEIDMSSDEAHELVQRARAFVTTVDQYFSRR